MTEARARALSKQYNSVFTIEPPGSMPAVKFTPPSDKMPPISFSDPGIHKLITSPNPTKTRGPDQIPTHVMNEAIEEVTPAPTKIFQHSHDTASAPDDWKKASIIAVHKKGDKTAPSSCP